MQNPRPMSVCLLVLISFLLALPAGAAVEAGVEFDETAVVEHAGDATSLELS